MKLGANEDFNAVGTSQLQPQWSVISLKRDFEAKEWTAPAFPGNPLCDFRERSVRSSIEMRTPSGSSLVSTLAVANSPVSSKNTVIGNPL